VSLNGGIQNDHVDGEDNDQPSNLGHVGVHWNQQKTHGLTQHLDRRAKELPPDPTTKWHVQAESNLQTAHPHSLRSTMQHFGHRSSGWLFPGQSPGARYSQEIAGHKEWDSAESDRTDQQAQACRPHWLEIEPNLYMPFPSRRM